MRYWLSNGDGKTYGPYEIDQLRALAAEGRVPPGSNLCAEGGTAWIPATQVLGVMQSPAVAVVAPSVQGTAIPNPVNIVWPILTILFCCIPGGVVALIYGINANAKAQRGDAAGAVRDAKTSQTWMIVSAILGVLVIILTIVAEVVDDGSRY